MSETASFTHAFRSLGADPAGFDELAIPLFRAQVQTNPVYRGYLKQLGISASSVSHWREIPALPTAAYKLDEAADCLGTKPAAIEFLTSGTSGESRGRHRMADARNYQAAVIDGWQAVGLATGLPFAFLAPDPADAPHSSLSHMMATLGRTYEALEPAFLFDAAGDWHLSPLIAQVETREPVFLFGTALAFLNLMEQKQPLALPEGSQLMETGGYKGSGRQLDKASFYTQLGDFFDIPVELIHNEYSMTELSSQCYARGLDGPHRCPPWVRVRVIDPETGCDLEPGGRGHLVIHDLANIDSCAAIEIEDLAILHDENHFTLIGRNPAALPRGCSRASDELLNQNRKP